MSFPEIIATITRGRVLSSFYVSFITAFAASAINAVMGLILAWVLVRYEFPGKRILDGMIELPFALPTAVAGISLTYLTIDSGWIGSFFAKFGIQIAYTRLGITFALIFVGIPFVVRSICLLYTSCDYTEPKDLRRCKVELPCSMGLCAGTLQRR